MDRQRIEELITKNALTREERAEVRDAAKAAGLSVKFRQACRSCYETALLKLYETSGGEVAVSVDGYSFRRRGDSFRLQGTVYSESTLHAQTVGKLHPNVVKMYFVKREPDNDPTTEPEPESETSTQDDESEIQR